MRLLLVLLLFGTLLSKEVKAQQPLQGSPYIKNYSSTEMNVGGPQIFSIVQDKRGMTYAGDAQGIIEFNGKEWKRIPNNNNSIVRSMAADSMGVIYVGASGDFGYLQPDSKGKMGYVSISQSVIDQGLKFHDIWKVIPTTHGVYYFSNKYIFKYFRKKISVIPVSFLVQDAYLLNNQLYLPTKKGLCLLKDSTLVEQTPKNFFLMTPLGKNKAMSISGGKLGIFNLLTLEFTEMQTDIAKYVETHPLFLINKIDDQKFALTTLKNAIAVISGSGELIQFIDETKGLMSGTIYSLFVDNDKNLWAGLSKGIAKIDINYPVLKFNERQDVPDNVQASCLFNGKRYIATINGIYYLPSFSIEKMEEGDKFVKIKNLEDECWNFKIQNNHLFAIGSSGVWEIKNTEATNIYPTKAPQNAHCFNTSPLFPDRIFIGMMGKLVAIKLKPSTSVKQVVAADEIDFPEITENIRRIVADKDGNLWLNTQFNGTYFLRFIDGDIRNYRVTLLGKQNGLPNLDVTRCFNVNNKIVITTKSGILQPVFPANLSAPDSLIHFEPSTLFGDTISAPYAIIAPVSQNKYLIAGDGIYYATTTNTSKQNFDTCGFSRLSCQVANINTNNDSVISICSPDGLFNYDTKNHRNFKKPFNTIISKVEINNDSIHFGGCFYNWVDSTKIPTIKQTSEFIPRIDYKYNSLTFHFSALFYEEPDVTKFQYQLVGFDKKWSNWSTENKSVFTNLPNGKYTFKVKAKNAYWKMSNVAEYEFTILPPWYKTWWAYLIYTLLFAAIVYLAMRLYAHRLNQQKKYLEEVVEERTLEIIEQANELKTINEKLVEMDKFKRGITCMIVHDLKNPINAIINAGNSNPETQLERIKQTGRQMLNLIMNILDVSKYEETKIKITIENHNLQNISSKAIEQILFLSNEKNITITNHIGSQLEIRADAEMIERVFVNILTNAIKYTPNNGFILINAETNSSETNKFYRISISDNGTGIPADKIHLVFQEFGQVIAKSSGSVRSTGLGLAYCKLAIEAHGGKINVISKPEVGSTFWFTLPKVYDNIAINQPSNASETYSTQFVGLSLTGQRLIKEHLLELKRTEIYKITELVGILNKIDNSTTDEIKLWKRDLIQAIDSGNQLMYEKLLNPKINIFD